MQTGGPLFPFSEADLLLKGEYNPVKVILWVTPGIGNTTTCLAALFTPFYQSILASLKLDSHIATGLPNTLSPNRHKNFPWITSLLWLPISNGAQISDLQKYLSSTDYIVVGSDNYTFRIALFTDTNSNNMCYQLVIMQEGRIRAVQPSPAKPSANETSAIAYASLIFYGNPLNFDILSFSLHPIAGARSFFIQNEELVTKLIAEHKLFARISTEQDPNSYNIPELPQ
ncbi:MAG: hypothetical protein PHS59_18660 [Paludibacter sp.]|nr:hypothetical protein [Paludibacter sp.]